MPISWSAPSVAIVVLLWTFTGAPPEAYGQSGGTQALESAEALLELSRSERRRIQTGLAAEGFDPGPTDGLFGRDTRGAIRAWQASRGEVATGWLNADAVKTLLEAGERSEAERQSAPGGGRTDAGNEILRDKYILGLSKALKADDYPKALEFIGKLEKLSGDLPAAVDYFRGEAYFHTEHYHEAIRALNRYIEKTGNRGRYYRKSLELILAAEEAEDRRERERKTKDAKFKVEIRNLISLLKTSYSKVIRVCHKGHSNCSRRSSIWTHVFKNSELSARWISPVKVTLDSTGCHYLTISYRYAINDDGKRKEYCSSSRKRTFTLDFTREYNLDMRRIQCSKGDLVCPRRSEMPYRLNHWIIHNRQQIEKIIDKWRHVTVSARELGYLDPS